MRKKEMIQWYEMSISYEDVSSCKNADANKDANEKIRTHHFRNHSQGCSDGKMPFHLC